MALKSDQSSRREWMGRLVMAVGLFLSYGFFAVQGMLFLLPRRRGLQLRKLFAGLIADFPEGGVKVVKDLQGNDVLVRRSGEEVQAFNSTCPHLGCKVVWVEQEQHYLCPCHRGIFNPQGEAIAGPPADAGQRLSEVPLSVDHVSGVVYIEVKEA